MCDEPNPNTTRTGSTGARKLLRLGHSKGVTLPAAWLKATGVADQVYVGYRVTVDGDLIFYPGGRAADGD